MSARAVRNAVVRTCWREGGRKGDEMMGFLGVPQNTGKYCCYGQCQARKDEPG